VVCASRSGSKSTSPSVIVLTTRDIESGSKHAILFDLLELGRLLDLLTVSGAIKDSLTPAIRSAISTHCRCE
jgi:hypothetical protein